MDNFYLFFFYSYTNGSINWKDEEKEQGEQQQLGQKKHANIWSFTF